MTDKIFKFIEKITPARWHQAINHSGYKRYFLNTSWMFGGQLFSLLISFFVSTWVARYLGPQNYGILSYSTAFVGIFSFISSLGIDGILNRDLINTPEKRDQLMGTSFYLKLIGGTVAFFVSVISVLIFQSDPLIKLLVILFSFSFILQSFNIIGNYFNAEVKAKNNVKTVLFATVISSTLKVFTILLGKGIIWIILIYLLDVLWQGIGFIVSYNNYCLKIKNWNFDKNLAIKILKNSWPLMFASAASFIYLKIDQVMIGSILGNYEVGIYAAAAKLAEVWYFIPGIICTSLFPAIINAKKTGIDLYRNRLKKLYILMIIISVAMAIPITILAKPIIYTLFGSGYMESVNILRIYIWSSIGLFLSVAIGQYLVTENSVKTIFILNLITMVINIILNLIFIPIWGLVGSAFATLISYFIIPIYVFGIKKIKFYD